MKDSIKEIKQLLKTKKLVFGTEQVIKNLKQNKIENFFISSNCNDETKKDLQHYAKTTKIEAIYLKNSNKFSSSKLLCESRYFKNKHEYVLRIAINGDVEARTINMQNTLDTIYYNNHESIGSKEISEFGVKKLTSKSGVFPIRSSKLVFVIDSVFINIIKFTTIYKKTPFTLPVKGVFNIKTIQTLNWQYTSSITTTGTAVVEIHHHLV